MQQNNDTICRNKFRVPGSRPKISKGTRAQKYPKSTALILALLHKNVTTGKMENPNKSFPIIKLMVKSCFFCVFLMIKILCNRALGCTERWTARKLLLAPFVGRGTKKSTD